MEPVGEWNVFYGIFSSDEAEFMAQLLGNSSLSNEPSFEFSSDFQSIHESAVRPEEIDGVPMYPSYNSSANMFSFSQESSYSTCESYYFSDSQQSFAMNNNNNNNDNSSSVSGSVDFRMGGNFKNTNLREGAQCLKQEMISNASMDKSGENLSEVVLHGKNLQITRDPEMAALPKTSSAEEEEEEEEDKPANSKKRSSISGNVQNKRNVKAKKEVISKKEEENNNNKLNGRQSSSGCCCSDDDGDEDNTCCMNAIKAKTTRSARPSRRGSATDPQSLYARKRRERINERLRILQNLVPNGTKVDISTMLEEAVQYVKFLQLQIKLLSSDDLWMYAPIAYNGMDIGLDMKIPTTRSS